MWLHYGACRLESWPLCCAKSPPYSGPLRPRTARDFLPIRLRSSVDNRRPLLVYNGPRRADAHRRDGAPLKLHRLSVGRASSLAGCRASTALWVTGEGASFAPGCLKSESEERETWTAESLRAASSAGEILSKGGRIETSAVHVLGQHPCPFVRRKPHELADDQNLIQLESLILAQSERWRQA
jgi:hypothetical protein